MKKKYSSFEAVKNLRNILHNFTTVSYLKFQDLFLTEKHGLDPKFYQT